MVVEPFFSIIILCSYVVNNLYFIMSVLIIKLNKKKTALTKR